MMRATSLLAITAVCLSATACGLILGGPDAPDLMDGGFGEADSGSRSHVDSGPNSKTDSGSSSKTDSGPKTDSGSKGKADSGPGDGASDDSRDDSGAGCVIGGKTYSSGTADPTNACKSCQPDLGGSAWNNVIDGTTCGSSRICHVGACGSGCEIGGAYYAANVGNPNNLCESCQPGATTSDWTLVADGTDCGNGQLCSDGECGTQCDIAGMVYASSAANPMNACQSCQPGVSTDTWSGIAPGTSCGSGKVCDGTTCTSGCYVSGTFYASTVANPGNACQICEPTMSTTQWTTANGMSCGPGEVCSGLSCMLGCYISGKLYAAGAGREWFHS